MKRANHTKEPKQLLEDDDVGRPSSFKLVHRVTQLALLHHHAHCHPVLLIQVRDRRRHPPLADLQHLLERHPQYSVRDLRHQRPMKRLLVADHQRLRIKHRPDIRQPCRPHRLPALNKIHDPVCQPEPARRLHAPGNVLDLRIVSATLPALRREPRKVPPRQVRKTRHYPLPQQLRRIAVLPNRHLHLQLAPPKPKLRLHFNPFLALLQTLLHNIPPRYPQIYFALAHVLRYIRRRKKHQHYLHVRRVRYIVPWLPIKLKPYLVQQLQDLLEKTPLLRNCKYKQPFHRIHPVTFIIYFTRISFYLY
ncbi:hypothetical protein AYI69_g983 [Smittium culicis]|uniref:Uncharacterized protein n=1 Tax=Smittium culicis TaxID=133412 RepID=A0A1R1YRJ2_9FUNG|nr:hypothetical protein AYI69_g983 [Smittium culicis]